MRHKTLILIILSLFLSGCNAIYKLEIKDNEFRENIEISMNNSETSSISYFNNNSFYAIVDGASNIIPYNKKVDKDSNDTKINFSYNYDKANYKKASALKSCFSAYNIVSENDYYIISTSKGIKCATEENTVLLDDLTVLIKTNHLVEESNNNTESENKNEYIWKFNKDNYDKAEIYMKIYKNKYVSDYNNEDKIRITVIVILACVVMLASLIVLIKYKKVQKV